MFMQCGQFPGVDCGLVHYAYLLSKLPVQNGI